MVWQLYYYDEVIVDISEAKRWYRKQQAFLDKRFAEDVKITISRMQKNPLHYEVRYRNIRMAFCDVFPYAIHFYVDEILHRLIIVAIVHQHRDPDYTKGR